MAADGLFELHERLGALLRSLLREAAARHGLQPVHLEALAYLARCNRYSNTPGAVGAYLGLTKGTVSQSLLLLERRGLVRRRPDRRDQRVVRLALTARGRRVLDSAWPPASWRQAADMLAPRAREDALEGARALLLALQAANGRRTFGLCLSCRHHLRTSGGARCGLTGEALTEEDAGRICAEHEPAAA